MTPVTDMTQADLLEPAAASRDLLRLAPGDDVAVALRELAAGERLTAGDSELEVRQAIMFGHKLALRDMAAGTKVRKFGWPIGILTAPVCAGDHVHSHNLSTLLGGVEGYAYEPAPHEPAGEPRPLAFQGYRRGDGRVGTRNEIWILPTVGCVARTASRIAAIAHARHAGAVDGVHAFAHPFGCSQLGEDLAGTRSVLAALACHPNAGGVLLVGLGCESNQLDRLLRRYRRPARPGRRFARRAPATRSRKVWRWSTASSPPPPWRGARKWA